MNMSKKYYQQENVETCVSEEQEEFENNNKIKIGEERKCVQRRIYDETGKKQKQS